MKETICLYGGYLYYPKERIVKFDEKTLEEGSLGGSDSWLIYTADMFSKVGFTVTVVCDCERYHFSDTGVEYVPVADSLSILKNRKFRYLISNGEYSAINYYACEMKIIMLHNNDFKCFDEYDREAFNENEYYSLCYLSEFQKKLFIEKYGLTQPHKMFKVTHGIDWSLYEHDIPKKKKMVWSSYKDRGLKFFIERVFPLIKREVPEFEVDVCTYLDDFEGEYDGIEGVNVLGSLNKRDLALRQLEASIWVYPNTGRFDDGEIQGETFCLTAVENAAAGNAIVVANKQGLSDTLSGYNGFVGTEFFVDGKEYLDDDTSMDLFAKALAERAVVLLRDEDYRRYLADDAKRVCSLYTFENSLKNWMCLLKKNYSRTNYSEYMVDELKTRLVFHIWLPVIKTDFYWEINAIHFACIRKYRDRFMESVFVISAEDIDDPSIEKLKMDIISLGLRGSINIKVIPNHPIYREAITFNDEIMFKMDKLDGVTFFSHNKGASKFEYSGVLFRNLVRWITFMYYMNLDDFNSVRHHLATPYSITYGTLLYRQDENWTGFKINENGWCYLGSLQWINTKKLFESYGRNKTAYDTSDAEMFIPNNFKFDHEKFRSFGFKDFQTVRLKEMLDDNDEFDRMLLENCCFDNGTYNSYNEFYNSIVGEACN